MDDRENLVKALQEIIEAYEWWSKDQYDRCQSVIHDAIEDAKSLLTSQHPVDSDSKGLEDSEND